MGVLSKILGGSVAEPIEAVGNVVTKIFGDKGEKLDHAEIMARIAQQPSMVQAEINKVEAAHRSIFVAGWRPFIGWVCGVGLMYAFLIGPVLDRFVGPGPAFPMDQIMKLVLAMLGLGAYRTIEKLQGRSK